MRICLGPNGAFYKSLYRLNEGLVTGKIEAVTEDAIKMVSRSLRYGCQRIGRS
ncbi:hypothetical protein GGR51DRAFT_501444 [Nemania sp. FL0031]|nr:hypothetical protein GGR51DRAFT_501444 [Nemania sp. FL0031]